MLAISAFFNPKSLHVYQNDWQDFVILSVEDLNGDADFTFQQDLAPAHTIEGLKIEISFWKYFTFNWFDAIIISVLICL